MVDSKEAQSAFFELMSKSVKNESSDQQSPAHSGATETGILIVVVVVIKFIFYFSLKIL